MPFTTQIDDTHSVTIRSSCRHTKSWEAEGEIFVTSTCQDINVTVYGNGDTMAKAEQDALRNARRKRLDG
jgi:hypothetical protein